MYMIEPHIHTSDNGCAAIGARAHLEGAACQHEKATGLSNAIEAAADPVPGNIRLGGERGEGGGGATGVKHKVSARISRRS